MKMLLSLSLMVAAAAGLATAQESITVRFDNASCSTAAGSSTFPAQTWSFGVTNPMTVAPGQGVGVWKPQIANLTLTRQLDSCSVALFKSSVLGTKSDKVTLTQTDATGRQTLMTVVLANAIVAGYVVSGSAATANPAETVSIGFESIQITYGGNGGPTFGWSLTTNRQLP